MKKGDIAHKKILECEKIFIDLKKLSEKQPSNANSSVMEIPASLLKV